MNFKLKSTLHSRPKKSAVSIYIGPESIEIVQVKKTIKGISVVKSITKDILKKDVTGSIIKEIFQREAIKDTTVTTCLPEESIMLRRFIMPIIPPQDRPTAIKFEAKRHIPFNIDEVISSYHIIKEDRIKNQMEILFVAVKKEEVNSIISLLESSGLTVERIEPISLALIKALNITRYLEEIHPPTAILHFLTKTSAQIVIVENGIPYIKREISLIAKDMEIKEHLINEIRLSTSYYKREFAEKNITKIILCGLKEKPVWFDSIKSYLDIPIEHALPLKEITGIDLPNPQLEIPIGLASRRLEKPKIELTLLPAELIPARYNIRKIVTVEISIAICILGLIYISQFPSLIRLKKDVDNASSKKTVFPELGLSIKSIDELNTLKTTWQQKRDILVTCTRNRVNWHEKLKRLAEIMPKETWINDLTIGDSVGIPGSRLLILKGSTYTPDTAKEIEITNDFSKNLKVDSVFMHGFRRLTLGTINKTTMEKYEVVNFDISVTTD